MTDALSLSNSGAELHQMIAENDGHLIFHFVGGGYGGPYPAAASGDLAAITVRDAVNTYLQRLFEVELENTMCFLCTELLLDAVNVGLVVVAAPIVPAPTRICCAPVCTRCWTELPELGELMHAVAQRYRTWLPDFVLTLHSEPGHG